MTDRYEEILDALAHEIWAAAQLAPGEGIVDGVARIVALLRDAAAGIRSLAASATSEPDADLELIWHSVSDNAETNAAYRRLKARLAALKAEKPTADEVLIAVKRDEGYEDVHPELVAEDFVSNPSAWCYRVLTPAG